MRIKTGLFFVFFRKSCIKELVKSETDKFLNRPNADFSIDRILKAAIAHFRFVVIRPFDDGKGRIARTITDMQSARAEKSSWRFYSLSSRILVEKNR